MRIFRGLGRRGASGRAVVLSIALLASVHPVAARADIVTDWSANAAKSIVTRGAPAGFIEWAIVHAAMYDAVNSIDRRHKPYKVEPTGPTAGASQEAAAAAAAHDALVGLFPAQTATLDAAYETSLAAVPGGPAKDRGIEIGREVATAILRLRSNDGRGTIVPYVFGSGPGVYQQTPPPYPPTGPVNTFLPQVTPMTLSSGSQFRAYGPPGLTSARYTRDFEEVRAYGSINSSVRTEEQSEIARFHTENPSQFWGRNLSTYVASRHLGTARSARLMTLLAFATADASLACFDSKYAYNFWRPVTAIRQADTDGNAATAVDPTWTAFVTTPPHPEYPAAHGCASGAVAHILREYFRTQYLQVAFDSTVTGMTHYYDKTDDLVREVVNARVYGGMHFRNSSLHGVALGKSIGKWVMSNTLQPTRGQR